MTGGTAFSPEEAQQDSVIPSNDGIGIFGGFSEKLEPKKEPVKSNDGIGIFGGFSETPSLEEFNDLDPEEMQEDPIGTVFPNMKRKDVLVGLKSNIFVSSSDNDKIVDNRGLDAFKGEFRGTPINKSENKGKAKQGPTDPTRRQIESIANASVSAVKSIPGKVGKRILKEVSIADRTITEFGEMLDDILESAISN